MAGVTEELIARLNAVAAMPFEGNDVSRQQLAMAARKLFHKLETKEEKTMRLAIEEPVMFSGLQVPHRRGFMAGLGRCWRGREGR